MGIAGLGLMVLSLVYGLRKRKLVVRFWGMGRWLSLHHWAGFLGGVLVMAHTLGDLNGLGLLMVALLLLVLSSSGIYFLEGRSLRPLREATAQLARERRERSHLDSLYRDLHARGQSGTSLGVDLYDQLLQQHERVQATEARVAMLRTEGASFTWWRKVHNYGTLMLLGVVIVHIWSKLYFKGVGL